MRILAQYLRADSLIAATLMRLPADLFHCERERLLCTFRLTIGATALGSWCPEHWRHFLRHRQVIIRREAKPVRGFAWAWPCLLSDFRCERRHAPLMCTESNKSISE
jgi:hypothetical protein